MCAQIRRAAGEGVRSRGVGDAKMAHTEQSPLLLNLVLGVRAVIVRKKVFLYTRHEDMAELEAFGAVDRANMNRWLGRFGFGIKTHECRVCAFKLA